MALSIIERRLRLAENPYVFPGRGAGSMNSFSNRKRDLDQKLPNIPRWVLHDLRRTSRSLMSRAGIDPDVAERCLGHVIPGVRGVYDRHKFIEEMRLAFERLASLIETLVHPRKNVVPLGHKG